MADFEGLELKSVLGSGSFGIVWKVINKEEKEFALKVILSDPENLNVQNRELDISSCIEHENLVKVFESYKTTISRKKLKVFIQGEVYCTPIINALIRKDDYFEIYYFKMELCGENLRQWLRHEHDKNWPKTRVKQGEIVQNIIRGLQYLHDREIIHRDLKPENIMFSKKGYKLPVKIGDYGTCRVLKDPQTSTLTSSVGTDLYSAPETSSNNYTLQSDLFSFGLIAWEVLQLIPIQNLRNHFDRLVNDREERVVQLSPRFENYRDHIIKLCDRNAQNRLKTIDQIALKFCNLGTELYSATETSSNDYTLQTDIFSLALIFLEVLQLTTSSNLKSHFDRLLYREETCLVGHIIKLNASERPNSISETGIETLTEIPRKLFSKLRETTAKNSAELQEILETCENGWTITLLEGEYQGSFEMRKNGLKLQGQGERTVLVPFNESPAGLIVLIVQGRNCTATNLKIHGKACPPGSGVSVQGSHCSLENLWISSFSEGVNIRSNVQSTTINNVKFEKVHNAVQILGNYSRLNNITVSNCFCAVKIEYAVNTFVSDLRITDPQQCGLQIQRCTDLKVNKVDISSKIKYRVGNQASHGISILGCISGKIELQNVSCSGFECGLFIDKKSTPSKITIQYDCNLGKIIGLDRPNYFKKLLHQFHK